LNILPAMKAEAAHWFADKKGLRRTDNAMKTIVRTPMNF
jgi:hypothetical protein